MTPAEEGPDRPPTPEGFLAALRTAMAGLGGAEWLAGRVDGGAVVVLFRQERIRGAEIRPGPVEGLRLVFGDVAAEILGPGPHRLRDVLLEAVLEVVEPHHPGPTLDVPWADGLCADPRAVRWRPAAVEAARRSR